MSEVEDKRGLHRYDAELRLLAESLIRIRRSLGMRIVDVAMNTGLSAAGLCRIENKQRSPTVRSILALSEVYRTQIVIENGKVTSVALTEPDQGAGHSAQSGQTVQAPGSVSAP